MPLIWQVARVCGTAVDSVISGEILELQEQSRRPVTSTVAAEMAANTVGSGGRTSGLSFRCSKQAAYGGVSGWAFVGVAVYEERFFSCHA